VEFHINLNTLEGWKKNGSFAFTKGWLVCRADVLVFQVAYFQVNHHKASEQAVVKDQVHLKMPFRKNCVLAGFRCA